MSFLDKIDGSADLARREAVLGLGPYCILDYLQPEAIMIEVNA